MLLSCAKKPSVYISAVILAMLILLYFLTLSPKYLKGEVVSPSTGTIEEEVMLTGTVQAARKVSLSFDRGGTIRALPFSVGAEVGEGTIIASLHNETEAAAVEEQKAAIAIEESRLAQLREGTRKEEIKLKEAEATKADVALQNSVSKTGTVLADAYSAGEEALSRYAAPFFVDDDTTTPRLTYSSGTQTSYDAETKRLQAGSSVKKVQELLGGGPALASLTAAVKELRVVQDLFLTLGLTLRDSSSLETSVLTDYRGRVTSARSAVTEAISATQNQMNAVRDAAAESDRAKRALELAEAGATPESIREAEAALARAQAKLRGIGAALEKTFLRAPFKGKISSRHVELGETVSSGDPILEFLGTNGFIIEVNVSEADITKVNVGDEASVTLDAYGEDVIFKAHIIEIDPGETKIEGVATYKTTLSLDSTDSKVRSGMTANINIKRVARKDAMVVPARAVTSEKGVSYITKMLPDGTTEKIEVTTGSRTSAGDIEILKGLSTGDKILISPAK